MSDEAGSPPAVKRCGSAEVSPGHARALSRTRVSGKSNIRQLRMRDMFVIAKNYVKDYLQFVSKVVSIYQIYFRIEGIIDGFCKFLISSKLIS